MGSTRIESLKVYDTRDAWGEEAIIPLTFYLISIIWSFIQFGFILFARGRKKGLAKLKIEGILRSANPAFGDYDLRMFLTANKEEEEVLCHVLYSQSVYI